MDMATTTDDEELRGSESAVQAAKMLLNQVRLPHLIAKKRDGNALTSSEIEAFVQGVTHELVPMEQIGAMLMAIYLRGMDATETNVLTQAMLRSGAVLSWPEHKGLVVDKHSTGGVGDKVSLPLAPALAACGLKVPMIAGRGLGHTGGTLDKLESIPGFSVNQSPEEMRRLLNTVGGCIVGQTKTLVPADRVLYSIRDITSTVENIPLITGSIVSKKLAEGLDALVLDVKVGRAAFMKSMDQARALAMSLQSAGQAAGVHTVAVLTQMDHPIGYMIGNALEVAESIYCLQGKGPADLEELVCVQGGHLLALTGKAASAEEGTEAVRAVLHNGAALAKFEAMVTQQGATPETAQRLCQDPMAVLPVAAFTTDVLATEAGVVVDIHAYDLAILAAEQGAGRRTRVDLIDYAVGLQLRVHVGATVVVGQSLICIHHSRPLTETDLARLQTCFTVDPKGTPRKGPATRIVEVIIPSAS